MTPLDAFIEKNYIVQWKNGQNPTSSSKIFLVATSHFSYGDLAMSSALINDFATESDVVLIEGTDETHVVPQEHLQSVWMESKAPISGWDWNPKENIDADGIQFYQQQTRVMAIVGRIIDNKNKEPNLLQTQLDELKKIYHTGSFLQITQELKTNEGYEKALEYDREDFSLRQDLLCETLESVISKESVQRIFIIAGSAHFARTNDSEDPRESPEALYHLLKLYPEIGQTVLLLPKVDEIKQLAAPYLNFHREHEFPWAF